MNQANGHAAAAAEEGCSHAHQLITSPTERDVINGRGQGVQRFKGNAVFRKLVFANKEPYCKARDKSTVPRALVAAIREAGGRFLKFDESTRAYYDIGDVMAKEKTQQALREGQKEVRQQLYARGAEWEDDREVSFDEYFGNCLQMLRTLHQDEGVDAAPLAPSSYASSAPLEISPIKVPSKGKRPIEISIPEGFCSSGADDATLAKVRDQFPTATMCAQPEKTASSAPEERLTSVSLGSTSSNNFGSPDKSSCGENNSRSTGGVSLMNLSVMTIGLDDMSHHEGERSSSSSYAAAV